MWLTNCRVCSLLFRHIIKSFLLFLLKYNTICTCPMHTALEYNIIAISAQKGWGLLFVFIPLHQIKALSTEYLIIQSKLQQKIEFLQQLYVLSKYIFYAGCQQKLGYEYDYGDHKHIWDTMGRLQKWIVCMSMTQVTVCTEFMSDDKTEFKIQSPRACQ